MNISSALDVAIGLILMYFLLSLFCTVINEFIATLLKWRAKTLQAAMEQLIDDPDLKAVFGSHGLIAAAKTAAAGGDANAGKTYPSYLSGGTVATALIDCLGILGKRAPAEPGVNQVNAAISAMGPSKIKDVLRSCANVAGNDINSLQATIAHWFDSAMDRLSGDYKRWMQYVSIICGLLIAIALNADSLGVAKSLWSDPTLRSTISQSASQIVSTKGTVPNSKNCPAPSASGGDFSAETAKLCNLNAALRPLPLGWTRPVPASTWEWVVKAFGILLTAIALTLGAPFWFDLLQNFVNLRGTGNKPQSSTQPSSP